MLHEDAGSCATSAPTTDDSLLLPNSRQRYERRVRLPVNGKLFAFQYFGAWLVNLQFLLQHHSRCVCDISVKVDILDTEETQVSLALSDAVRHIDSESNEFGAVMC